MEKNRFLKVIIICLLLLNLGILSFLFYTHLGNKRHHHGDGNKGPAKFIIEKLGFDEQQISKFNDLKSEHQQKMHKLQDSIKIQRDLLPEIIIEGNDAKADSISAAIGTYQKQMEFNTYQHFKEVRNLCNEEQKKKFKSVVFDILKMMGSPKNQHPLN